MEGRVRRRAGPAEHRHAAVGGGDLTSRLAGALAKRIERGSLMIVGPDGTRLVTRGARPGPDAELRIRRGRFLRRLLFEGGVGLGRSYVDGDWESSDLAGTIEALALNEGALIGQFRALAPLRPLHRLAHRLRPNSRAGSRANIAAHYDLGNDFFAAWLDDSMTYSSALFTPGRDETLAEAQDAKYHAVARLAGLAPGMRVLEIGSGWGGFASVAARSYGCDVTGLTLSERQCAYANARAASMGQEARVRHQLCDYRDGDGTFDAVVSIEMIEAIGESQWPTFFAKLRERLRPEGVATLQVITIDENRFARYRRSADFIQLHVFPGGMLPTKDALDRFAADAGLRLTTTFFFGESYALTLSLWRERFEARWPEIRSQGYDDRFRRLWRYYLAYCEAGFRASTIDVGLYRIERSR
jgi:cyclopropane-fatty-acyl-phospholipid synthase